MQVRLRLTLTVDTGAVSRSGPTMQLYREGELQGITVNAIPKSERPPGLDGTYVSRCARALERVSRVRLLRQFERDLSNR